MTVWLKYVDLFGKKIQYQMQLFYTYYIVKKKSYDVFIFREYQTSDLHYQIK